MEQTSISFKRTIDSKPEYIWIPSNNYDQLKHGTILTEEEIKKLENKPIKPKYKVETKIYADEQVWCKNGYLGWGMQGPEYEDWFDHDLPDDKHEWYLCDPPPENTSIDLECKPVPEDIWEALAEKTCLRRLYTLDVGIKEIEEWLKNNDKHEYLYLTVIPYCDSPSYREYDLKTEYYLFMRHTIAPIEDKTNES